MSVLASLFSGISGINANGSAMSVSGDNIANMNTIAFKGSNALFESNLTQNIGQAEVGLGSNLAATNTNFAEGSFESSSRPTDMAIAGSGFFVTEDSQGGRFYTRAGAFQQDRIGDFVSSVGGGKLQGYEISQDGQVSGSLSTVNITGATDPATPTSELEFLVNLDSGEEVPDPFNPDSFEDASNTSNFEVSQTLYDSLGNARETVTYYRKDDNNEWEFFTLTDVQNLDPDNLDDPNAEGTVVLKSGTLDFNSDGSLDGDPTFDGSNYAQDDENIEPGDNLGGAIPWDGGAGEVDDLDFDFMESTQNASDNSQVFHAENDGGPVGELQNFEVEGDGTLRGTFTNGNSRALFQIPLASFSNEGGLSRAASNTFQATAESGEADIAQAGTGGRGDIQPFQLEQSNVDIAKEFVNIIQYQRGFQASARTISSSSELLQELVNLGR